MDKKLILICLGILLIGNLSAMAVTQNVTVNVLPEKIAYILRDSTNPDEKILETFDEMKLEVVLISDEKIKSTNFSDYRAVFIGDQHLQDVKYIPEMPTIIANKYYAKEFGFIFRGTIAQLASNSILKIHEDSAKTRVYQSASFWLGGPNLFYYYIPYKNKRGDLNVTATTINGQANLRGSVVAYSSDGSNKCFFGIIKTKYWTEDSKKLFKDCVNFAIAIK